MNCFICQEEFDAYLLDHYLTCPSCRDYYRRNKDRQKELYQKIEGKKEELKKYRKENLKCSTIAYKQAEIIIGKIISAFGFSVEKERIFFPYIADFYMKDFKCIVEIDGGVHDKQISYDDRRDSWLQLKYDLTVIRYDNKDIGSQMFKESIWELGEKYFNNTINKINFIANEIGMPLYRLERLNYAVV